MISNGKTFHFCLKCFLKIAVICSIIPNFNPKTYTIDKSVLIKVLQFLLIFAVSTVLTFNTIIVHGKSTFNSEKVLCFFMILALGTGFLNYGLVVIHIHTKLWNDLIQNLVFLKNVIMTDSTTIKRFYKKMLWHFWYLNLLYIVFFIPSTVPKYYNKEFEFEIFSEIAYACYWYMNYFDLLCVFVMVCISSYIGYSYKLLRKDIENRLMSYTIESLINELWNCIKLFKVINNSTNTFNKLFGCYLYCLIVKNYFIMVFGIFNMMLVLRNRTWETDFPTFMSETCFYQFSFVSCSFT